MSADGNMVISAGNDGMVRLWERRTPQTPVKAFEGRSIPSRLVAIARRFGLPAQAREFGLGSESRSDKDTAKAPLISLQPRRPSPRPPGVPLANF